MTRFDPIEEKQEIRLGQHSVLEPPAAWYARLPNPALAAELDLERILRAWLVGEHAAAAPRLEAARNRLEAAFSTRAVLTPDNALALSGHWQGLGLARWLAGDDPQDADTAAFETGLMLQGNLEGANTEEQRGFLQIKACDLLLDALFCGRAGEGLAVLERLRARCDIPLPEDVALAQLASEGAAPGEIPVHAVLAGLSRPGDAAFIRTRSAIEAARWLRLVHGATGQVKDPEAALLMLYDLDGTLTPPWRDERPGPPVSLRLKGADLADAVNEALAPLGYTLNAADDWSRPARREGHAHLARRGGQQGTLDLAGALAPCHARAVVASLHGRIGVEEDDSLERVLSQPGAAPMESAQGALRWRAVQDVMGSGLSTPATLLLPMLRAGLVDPDWRVRMSAMLAAAQLKETTLAQEVERVAVPAVTVGVISQEERRCLLILREAARAMTGAPQNATRAANPAVAEALRLIAGEALPFSRLSALFAVLRGDPLPAGTPLPKAWRRWAYG